LSVAAVLVAPVIQLLRVQAELVHPLPAKQQPLVVAAAVTTGLMELAAVVEAVLAVVEHL
jgi:hypothetical protein